MVAEKALFRPNDLSLPRREFVLVSDASLLAQILGVLEQYVPNQDFSTVQIHSSKERPRLGNAFLVTIRGDKYFLKCRSGREAGLVLSCEAQLAAQLSSKGIKVSRPVFALSNDPVAAQGEYYFALYTFEDGKHFTGHGRELDSAAETFGRLAKVATETVQSSGPVEFSGSGTAFLTDLESLVDEATGNKSLDTDFRNLWEEHLEAVVKSLNAVQRHNAELTADIKLLHSDYHPLNILMNQEEVACVLDLEDLRAYPVLGALGFGAYKLIREMLVNPVRRAEEFRCPSLVRRWLEGWRKSFPESRVGAAGLSLGARYRVLSLVHVILNAYIRHHDTTYNYDLEKQLLSFYEIDLIFGPDSGTA